MVLRNLTIAKPNFIDPGLVDYLEVQLNEICDVGAPLNLGLLLIFLLFTKRGDIAMYTNTDDLKHQAVG